MRGQIIKIFTFLGGIYFFLEFLLSKSTLEYLTIDKYHEAITDGFILIGTMAFGLGIINLLTIHGSKIIFKRTGWLNSTALIIGLFLTTIVGSWQWGNDLNIQAELKPISDLASFARVIEKDSKDSSKNNLVPDTTTRISSLVTASSKTTDNIAEQLKLLKEEYSIKHYEKTLLSQILITEDVLKKLYVNKNLLEQSAGESQSVALQQFTTSLSELNAAYGETLRKVSSQGLVSNLWDYLFNGLFVALGSAMFSLLGVYIAAAAYRAFRVKTFESSLMMLAAIIVMLGQIPFGVWIYEDLPAVRLWLMEVPSSGAFRAIKIGAAIAGLVMAFRMWLSIESDFSAKKNA